MLSYPPNRQSAFEKGYFRMDNGPNTNETENEKENIQKNTYRCRDLNDSMEVYKASKIHVHSRKLPIFTEAPHLTSGDEQTETERLVS